MCSDQLYICALCRLPFEDNCEFAFDGYNYDIKHCLDCLGSK